VIPTPETVSALVHAAVKGYDASRPRSIQAREGRIGPSDLGFCQQKALLTLKGVPYSDSRSIWPAVVGTAVGEFVEAAIKAMFPDWIVGSIDEQDVTYTLLNGATITGRPDIIAPQFNAVLDLKTKDGLIKTRREGASRQWRYQRHAYVMGAVAAGLLDGDKPLYIGNIVLDRSGADEHPFVIIEEVDPTLDDEINAWVDDVIYARLHNQDAEREIAPAVCERICEFFTVCRGSLPVSDEVEVFTDPSTLLSIEMYVEGREIKNDGVALMDAGKVDLLGLNGIGAGHQVRTTFVPETRSRASYDKLEVIPLRGRQGHQEEDQ
jgi:hypothetical protein